jgi:hypothetical protein
MNDSYPYNLSSFGIRSKSMENFKRKKVNINNGTNTPMQGYLITLKLVAGSSRFECRECKRLYS